MKNFPFLFLSLFFFLGCANQVKQVETSVPIVENQVRSTADDLPSSIWASLDSNNTAFVNIEGDKFSLGHVYSSAGGNVCRKLMPSASTETPRLACKGKQGWYLSQNILSGRGSQNIEGRQ